MASTYALYVAVSFHGEVVEEQSIRFGESVQIGNSSAVAVPVPEGHDHLARLMWTAPDVAVVQTATGGVHEITPGQDLTIDVGPVSLRLYLVEQFRIQRAAPWSSITSLAWFAVVMISTLVTIQADWAHNERCFIATHWLRDYQYAVFPECRPAEGDAGGGGQFTAEYIARLLKKDFDGEDEGLIETVENMDRPDEGSKIEDNHVFLPAGDDGPITKMGGAEETAPEPVRNVDDEEIAIPKQKVEEQVPLAVEQGEAIVKPAEPVEAEVGEDEGLRDVPEEERDELDLPAEEEEGWGIPDWYDERDAEFEDFVIRYQLQYVRERLRIDPDDVNALSALSYYQYLAQDYDGAVDSYNRIIELMPESSNGYNNKALVYKRRGEYRKEEALYRIALSIEPLDDIVMNNLAVNLSHQGRFDEALAIMEQLEQIVPGDAYANLHRSKIYAELGDEEKALKYLQVALEGFETMDTLHRIEFRQDIRLDPSFEKLRESREFRRVLADFFGKDSPLAE